MDPINENSLPFLTRKMLAFNDGTAFQLILQLIAHSTQPIEVRGITKEGPFTYRVTPVGDSSIETFTLAIPDIPIAVSVQTAVTSTNVTIAFAILHLAVNGNRLMMLAQGEISVIDGISWPHTPIATNQQILGPVVNISITNPAAGEELAINVPDNQVWEVLGISFTFTASATVATRTVNVDILPDSAIQIRRTAAGTIVANEVNLISVVPGGTTGDTVAGTFQEIAMPLGMFMIRGGSINTITTNLQAGDQYSGISILVRRTYKANNPS